MQISLFAASAAASWTWETGLRKNMLCPSRSSTRKGKKRLNPTSEKAITTKPEAARPLFALAIATSLGAGYLPLAPGTWGSAVALALVSGTAALARSESGPAILVSEFSLLLALAAIGLWASQRVVAAAPSEPDPGYVVIDELSGQTITLVAGLALSAWTAAPSQEAISAKISAALATGLLNWKYLLAGFILFRVFDIWKPFPARRAELLPGGLGIMADDWVAGAYAALGLWLIRVLGF
jgi:phosphatidylglycerophosphatase A